MTLRQSLELALARLGGNPRLLTDADIAVLRSVDPRFATVADAARKAVDGRTRVSTMPCSPSPAARPSAPSEARA